MTAVSANNTALEHITKYTCTTKRCRTANSIFSTSVLKNYHVYVASEKILRSLPCKKNCTHPTTTSYRLSWVLIQWKTLNSGFISPVSQKFINLMTEIPTSRASDGCVMGHEDAVIARLFTSWIKVISYQWVTYFTACPYITPNINIRGFL